MLPQVLTNLRPSTLYRAGVAAFSDSGVSRALTSLPTAVDGVRAPFTFRTMAVYSDVLVQAQLNGKKTTSPTFVFVPFEMGAQGAWSPSLPGLYDVNITWLQGVCPTNPWDSCLNTSFIVVRA